MGIKKKNTGNVIKVKSGSKSAKMIIAKSLKANSYSGPKKKSQKKISKMEDNGQKIDDKIEIADADDPTIELGDENETTIEDKVDTNTKSKTKSKPTSSNPPPETKKKINELEKLNSFMLKFKAESQQKSGMNLPWSHTCTHLPYGKYLIPEDMTSKFLKLYSDAVAAGFHPHIVEKHREIGPILIDLDFVQEKEHADRYYSNITLVNVIKIYNQIIRKYLDVTPNQLDAFVLEKKQPNLRKGQYHDGIHIIYPFICTKPSLQMLIREEAIEKITEHNIFEKFLM